MALSGFFIDKGFIAHKKTDYNGEIRITGLLHRLIIHERIIVSICN